MEKTGIKLIDTFVYSGKEFLDKRVFCENISELKATDATSIPEGFMRYVKSEQKWYKYDSNSVSNRNTGYWHGIDGFDTMDDSEFVYAIVDNKGNLVWGIKKDGSVYQQGAELNGPIKATGAINVGGGITANGDLIANGSATFSGPIIGKESLTLSDTKISEIYNDEFIYAIVDYTGHVLFGIKQDGTIFIPRGMSDDAAARFAELASIEVNDSEEFPFAIVDMLDSILFGIRNNGEVYIPKGQPEETKARFEELKLIQVNDSTEFPFAIIDASNNIVFAIKYTGEVYIPKGLPEEVRVRFEELKPIEPNLSEEYPFAIVDPTDLMVFGVNKEGEMYAAKGQPEETKARFKELDSIKPNESESMPFAIVTQKGGVALGVTNEGEIYIGKGQPEETKARLTELEPIHTLDAESEYNYTIVDTNDNLLFGIKKTGEVVIPGGVEDGSLEGASGFQVMHNEQYVFAITDSKDKVLFGIDKKGHSFVNGIDGVAAIEQFDSKDFVYAIMDSNDNLLFGIKKDGKTYIKTLDYDPNNVISYIQPLEDHEFVYTILDNKGKILFGIRKDGYVYIPKGVSEETEKTLKSLEKRVNTLENNDLIEINNIGINKVMYDGSKGRTYLGNVALQTPGQTDYCIIMMYGQSLSNGSENPAGFYDTPVEGCYMLGSNVWNTTGDTLQPLSVGGTVREDKIATGTRQDTIVSTVNSFVTLYKKERPWDKNTKFIACSLGVGGRTVAQLSGAARYPYCNEHNLDTRVRPFFESVKAIADSEGKTISLSAVFWKQGESDYGTGYIGKTYEEWKELATAASQVSPTSMAMQGSKNAYYKGLTLLKEDIFALAKEIFGENQANRPVFMPYSVCGTYISNAYMTINEATSQMAEDQDDVIQVGPTYVTPDYNGGHLAMNGYRWFGEYCAKALYHVFLRNIDWKPMQPYNYEVSGNQIFIYMNAPVLPLRFDKYTIDNVYKDFGFTVRMGTIEQLDSAKTITSNSSLIQTITKIDIIENCVVLTCGNIDHFSDVVEVTYAGQGQSGYYGHSQGAGNLRDSDTWSPLYSYRADSGDHGSRRTFSAWQQIRIATESDISSYNAWTKEGNYNYGDYVIYENTYNSVTYLLKSNKDNNTSTPYSSGTRLNEVNYWNGSTSATQDELETLEFWDPVYASSTGYVYGDKVLFNVIEKDSPIVLTNNYGDTEGSVKNKALPFGPVNYTPVTVKGENLIDKKYPMQNWSLNFYKRIIIGEGGNINTVSISTSTSSSNSQDTAINTSNIDSIING